MLGEDEGAQTEDDVVDTALGVGMLLFLLLLFGSIVLEQTELLPGAIRLYPYALAVVALLGVAWLLWKSPIIEE